MRYSLTHIIDFQTLAMRRVLIRKFLIRVLIFMLKICKYKIKFC